jgi:hypothetical protein
MDNHTRKKRVVPKSRRYRLTQSEEQPDLSLKCGKGKGKGKIHLRTDHEGPGWQVEVYSTLPLTSALDGGDWLVPRPSRFTPGKDKWYTLYRRLYGSQGLAGRVRKISSPPELYPSAVQPLATLKSGAIQKLTCGEFELILFFYAFVTTICKNVPINFPISACSSTYML